MSNQEPITAYTDGACLGNPGPGGWGVVLLRDGAPAEELQGGEALTTNNRMELMAAIQALSALPAASEVLLRLDSDYVRLGITQWIERWKLKRWRTADGKPVKNQDLWQRLDTLASERRVQWQWVRGHSGEPGNERADALAYAAARQAAQHNTAPAQ